MNLTDGAKALLMFDVMKGQATNAVIWLLKKNNCIVIRIAYKHIPVASTVGYFWL